MNGSSVKSDNKLKILIIGPGALGTYFATKLQLRGHKVVIWGNPEKINKTIRAQLTLKENDNKIKWRTLVKPTPHTPKDRLKFDIVFLCVKAYSLEKVKNSLQNLLSDYFVVPQNGTGFEKGLFKVLKGKPLRAVVTIGLLRKGKRIVIVKGKGRVLVPKTSQTIAKILNDSGIETEKVENIEEFVMKKLIINSVINPLTTILGIKNGILKSSKELRSLVNALTMESTNIVNLKGYRFHPEEMVSVVWEVIENTRENFSSMLQDTLKGNPTEIDYINGEILRIARRYSVSAPINLTVYALVKTIESLNRASLRRGANYNSLGSILNLGV